MKDSRLTAEPDSTWLDRACFYASPILKKLAGWDEHLTRQVIENSYRIDKTEAERIGEIPQRTIDWHKIRNGWIDALTLTFRGVLISSSIAGKVLGHKKKYNDPLKYEGSNLPMLANMYLKTQRGTACEPHIREEFKVVLKEIKGGEYIVNIEEVGIQIDTECPWMAASPDGILHFFNTKTKRYEKGGLEMKCRGGETDLPYTHIPHDYYDQIMHTMYILKLSDYWFVCHSKNVFSVEKFEYNKSYWDEQMSILERFYWENYWPTLVLFYSGILTFDEQDENIGKNMVKLTGDDKTDSGRILEWAMENCVEEYMLKHKPVKRIMTEDWIFDD